MRVVLLGTGGYHPSEERHTACIMLPEIGVVLDAGTGAFRIPRHLATPTLDIFLSHAHLDHVVGLTYLLAPLAMKQLQSVRLHARDSVLAAVREHLFSQPLFPVLPDMEWLPLSAPVVPTTGVEIVHRPLPSHPGGSMGYRLNIARPDGSRRSLAYVTDTSVDDSYTDFIRDADVLIHECYFPDSMLEWARTTGHSTVSQVLRVATEARVGRLILVHVDPRSSGSDPLELGQTGPHPMPVEVAVDGLELEL